MNDMPLTLWLRAAIFTILVPAVVGGYAPQRIVAGATLAPGLWAAGWLLVAAGTLLYFWCLVMFVFSGGTPAVFFTRPLRFLIGSEPDEVVHSGPYRFSRNPMYVAVVAAILGQAAVYRSAAILRYGIAVAVTFHLVVVLIEEPHLRAERGAAYAAYCQSVRRWL
jgi:protein-S-isoprenylcysteine O-methyltransferase Ste14